VTPARCWKVKGRGHPGASREKLRTEAPVNGGRNYCLDHPRDLPWAHSSYKIWLYAGKSREADGTFVFRAKRDNPSDRDNQQERPERRSL